MAPMCSLQTMFGDAPPPRPARKRLRTTPTTARPFDTAARAALLARAERNSTGGRGARLTAKHVHEGIGAPWRTAKRRATAFAPETYALTAGGGCSGTWLSALRLGKLLGAGGYGAVFAVDDANGEDSTTGAREAAADPDDAEGGPETALALKVEHNGRDAENHGLPWELYAARALLDRCDDAVDAVRSRFMIPIALHVHGGAAALVMPRLGATLHDVAAAHARAGIGLDETLAAWYASQMLDALVRLRAARVVHGDIKLDNWLLRGGDSIVLCDFGRAVDLDLYAPDTAFAVGAGKTARTYAGVDALFRVDADDTLAALSALIFGLGTTTGVGAPAVLDPARMRSKLQRSWGRELWGDVFRALGGVGGAGGGAAAAARVRELEALRGRLDEAVSASGALEEAVLRAGRLAGP